MQTDLTHLTTETLGRLVFELECHRAAYGPLTACLPLEADAREVLYDRAAQTVASQIAAGLDVNGPGGEVAHRERLVRRAIDAATNYVSTVTDYSYDVPWVAA